MPAYFFLILLAFFIKMWYNKGNLKGGINMLKAKKYKVYDIYEGKDTVGYADTIEEVKKLARRWHDDVDGECCIVYAELNKESGKYKFSNYKEVCY